MGARYYVVLEHSCTFQVKDRPHQWERTFFPHYPDHPKRYNLLFHIQISLQLFVVWCKMSWKNEKQRIETFANLMEYKYYQNKFQHQFGPPLHVAIKPPEGCEIFVSKIPAEMFEIDLYRIFSQVGEIFQIRLMMNSDGNSNRGFAFITYMCLQGAETAVTLLNGIEFQNSKLHVIRSLDNKRLFLGGIDITKNRDDIWKELMKQGMANIVDVIMYRSYTNRRNNRGFVFVEFASHKEAAAVRNRCKNLVLFGQKVVIDWSVPIPTVTANEMAQVKNLFIRNLPVAMQRSELMELICPYLKMSALEKVYKFKDYAFINFPNRLEAKRALTILSDLFSNTIVEVMWAKPACFYTKPSSRNHLISNLLKKNNKQQKFESGSPTPSTSGSEATSDFQTANKVPDVSHLVGILEKLGINYFF